MRTKSDGEQKSIFLLEMMTLVSSTNNIGSDTEFILRGRSFINDLLLTREALEWSLVKLLCFNVPQSEEKLYMILLQISVF